MELQWMSPHQSMLIAKLDDGEAIGSVMGAGSFQIASNTSEMAAIEAMEPPATIADPPTPLTAAGKAAFKLAEEQHAKAVEHKEAKAAEHAKAAHPAAPRDK
jgi:hypothetical protein